MSERDDLRPLLFSIAYRMLGSVAEAEDVVQEALLREQRARAEGVEIESRRAWLTSVATRLAVDQLRSARRRREQYVGPWLPEPLLVDPSPGPAQAAELADSLSLAFLVLLETLSPLERAVFVLREVFDYGYAEIGEILGRSEESCRQLATRARRHVEERKPRYEVSRTERNEVAARFFAAFERGDAAELVAVLAPDVVVTGDGGGRAPALPQPLFGRDRAVKALLGFSRQGRRVRATLEPVLVNGQPGAVARDAEGRVAAVLALEIADGLVQGVKSVVNPEKLAHLGEPADLRALLRRG
ncbi:MAG TPA: RNA polymerase sigma-70 factor [Gaiellaceae bacterium]|nr:RNA polymerase sigma-70 factor [Gaiellaceae bacterium]